jgi:hypothetical protein
MIHGMRLAVQGILNSCSESIIHGFGCFQPLDLVLCGGYSWRPLAAAALTGPPSWSRELMNIQLFLCFFGSVK